MTQTRAESMGEFLWQRPRSGDGYVWAEWPRKSGTTVRRLVRKPEAEITAYDPLSLGIALHRELAAAEPTPEGALAFANRYGSLGSDRTGEEQGWEQFEDWYRHIVWLKEAVRLWDMIQEEDVDGLARVIEWEGAGVVHYWPPPDVEKALGRRRLRGAPRQELQYWKGWDILEHAPDGADVKRRVREGDVLVPALLFVHSLVNGEIWQNIGPILAWDAAQHRTVLREVPRDLRAFIYLQFAQEMRSLRKPRRCPVCGRWFELAPDAGEDSRRRRSDRETCSTACRSKAYRERQNQARQLHAVGKTFKEIAKELGSDVKTIKGWVTKRRG
jgi:hypothetical protein